MPDIDDHEHDGSVQPRKPTKGDYVNARRFDKGRLPLPCRLWMLGHRNRMYPHEWNRVS